MKTWAPAWIGACAILLILPLAAPARTVYRCVRGGTVSLATAPEPGSKCVAKHIEDDAAKLPNLWGNLGVVQGTLYERVQDGKTVYSTRKLPGSTPLMRFLVQTPPGSPAHVGLGKLGPPRLDRFARQFRATARKRGVEDAMLRAFAHAESGFVADAVSPKGARGVMQLMPDVISDFEVEDPLSSSQSIDAGARLLRALMRRYSGDIPRVAAAYNAGPRTVDRYGGVPPYRETIDYVAKVEALLERYREALKAE